MIQVLVVEDSRISRDAIEARSPNPENMSCTPP